MEPILPALEPSIAILAPAVQRPTVPSQTLALSVPSVPSLPMVVTARPVHQTHTQTKLVNATALSVLLDLSPTAPTPLETVPSVPSVPSPTLEPPVATAQRVQSRVSRDPSAVSNALAVTLATMEAPTALLVPPVNTASMLERVAQFVHLEPIQTPRDRVAVSLVLLEQTSLRQEHLASFVFPVPSHLTAPTAHSVPQERTHHTMVSHAVCLVLAVSPQTLIVRTARPVLLDSFQAPPESPAKTVPLVNTPTSRDSVSANLAAVDTKPSMTPDLASLALLEPIPPMMDLAFLAPLDPTPTSLLPLNASSVLAVTAHRPIAATARNAVLVSSQTSESNAKLVLLVKSPSLTLLALALPVLQEPLPLPSSENQSASLASPETILLMVSLAFLALLEPILTAPERVHALLVSAVPRVMSHVPSALFAVPETSRMPESLANLAPTLEDSAASAVPANVQTALLVMSLLPQTHPVFLANPENTTMVLSPSVSHVPMEQSLLLMEPRAALLVSAVLSPAPLLTFASLALLESTLLQEVFARSAPLEHTPLLMKAAAVNSVLLDLLP